MQKFIKDFCGTVDRHVIVTEMESGRVGSARTRRSKPEPDPKPRLHKEARFGPTIVFPIH